MDQTRQPQFPSAADAKQGKRLRLRRLHLTEIPRLRTVGIAIVIALVFGHEALRHMAPTGACRRASPPVC